MADAPPASRPLPAEITVELMREALAAGETLSLAVRGSCMEPLVRDGDRVTVAPLGPSGARVGELILALEEAPGESGPRWVCHRLLGIRDGLHLHAGDATHRVGRCPGDAILGRAVTIHRSPSGGRTARSPLVLHWPAVGQLLARLHLCSLERQGSLDARIVDYGRALLLRLVVALGVGS